MEPPNLEQLPNYASPPVVETVLGMQFDPMPRFTNAHLGAFWKFLDADVWPTVVDAPPIPLAFERFTEEAKWAKGLRLTISEDLGIRIQIRNKSNDRMIQVQNGRIHFNWLGENGAEYPRFDSVRTEFALTLDRFCQFIRDELNTEMRPNQWEVSYVNHIPKGDVWQSPQDWTFFRLFGIVPHDNGIKTDGFSGEWRFEIPAQRGRLHVKWQHAKMVDRQDEFVRLELTARGEAKKSSDFQPVLDGIDLGRETIVRSFKSFMTDEMNEKWGLQ